MSSCWCWGSGAFFKQNVKDIESRIDVRGIIDSDAGRWGRKIGSYTIYSPNSIGINDSVLITTANINSVLMSAMDFQMERIKEFLYWDNTRKTIVDISQAFSKCIFSLDGEELYLKEKYPSINKGFYVDVGSHHPFRFSNTQWAYARGWRGINIDPNKDAINLFDIFRPDDVNLNCGISDEPGVMDYLYFEESAINTFVKSRDRSNGSNPIKTQSVEVKRLDDIFDQYEVHHVDFLDIDVEGMEYSVINSIDFDKVKIDTILVEQLPIVPGKYSVEDIIKSPIYEELSFYGYVFTNKYNRTIIYEHN